MENCKPSSSKLLTEYNLELQRRQIQCQESKWDILFKFRSLLCDRAFFSGKYRHTLFRIANNTIVLYHTFFHCHPNKFSTYTNFRRCLHLHLSQVHDDANLGKRNKIKPEDNLSKKQYEIPKQINHYIIMIYKTFDVLNNNQIDWRQFCLMIHIMSCIATVTFQEMLCLGFRYFSNSSSAKLLPADKINFEDLEAILQVIIISGENKIHDALGQIFENIWINFCYFGLNDENLSDSTKRDNHSFLSLQTKKINFHTFRMIFKHTSFIDFIKENKKKNYMRDTGCLTSSFENK